MLEFFIHNIFICISSRESNENMGGKSLFTYLIMYVKVCKQIRLLRRDDFITSQILGFEHVVQLVSSVRKLVETLMQDVQ